jgi:hypothetical protein
MLDEIRKDNTMIFLTEIGSMEHTLHEEQHVTQHGLGERIFYGYPLFPRVMFNQSTLKL